MSANTIWNVAETDFPAGGTAQQKLGYALKCAAMAAVMEEWQPWQFRLIEGHIELYATDDQASEVADSDGRELMIRCGAALFHLKLALKRFGCLGRVELFPDLDQAGLVARIHCGFSQDHDAQEAALFEAMTRSRKNFAPSGEAPVSEAILESLNCNLAGEKAWLEFSQSESSRKRLLTLAESGVRQATAGQRPKGQGSDNEIRQFELSRGALRNSRLAQWTRPFLTFTVRNAGSEQIAVQVGGRRADQMAVLAVVKTKTDDKHGWLAAGKAMAQARLQAQVLGVSCCVFDQAFRNRHVREELRTTIGRKGFVQSIIGFGSHMAQWTFAPAAQQSATATMR
jgi:hypothetical protein